MRQITYYSVTWWEHHDQCSIPREELTFSKSYAIKLGKKVNGLIKRIVLSGNAVSSHLDF